MNEEQRELEDRWIKSREWTRKMSLFSAEDTERLMRLLIDNGYDIMSVRSEPYRGPRLMRGHVTHHFEIRKFLPSPNNEDQS
jgi:hypothetical protein